MRGFGEVAIVGVGGEAAGRLGRWERLLAHAGEEKMLGRDVAGGGGGQHADAAGFVVRARERDVGGDVAKQCEKLGASELARRLVEPGVEALDGGEVGRGRISRRRDRWR